MNCPIDNTELRITDRQGIEVDYCPKCRGVWLDRGELDKLIERSAPLSPRLDRDDDLPDRDRARRDDRARPYREEDDDDDDDRRYPGGRGSRKSKRRSFLEDLFDID